MRLRVRACSLAAFILLLCVSTGAVASMATDIADLPVYPYMYLYYPDNVKSESIEQPVWASSENSILEWDIDTLKPSGRVPERIYGIPYPETTMIDYIKRRDQSKELFLTASQFYSKNKLYFKLKVTDQAVTQCVDNTQDFGFVYTPVSILQALFWDENGMVCDYTKQLTAPSGQTYLAETFFVKNENGKSIIAAAYGNRQKPLQKGKEYIVCITGVAVRDSDDAGKTDFSVTNSAALVQNETVFFYDELYFWDINDLEKEDAYLKKLTDTGLYSEYESVQYPFVNEINAGFNRLAQSIGKIVNDDPNEQDRSASEREPNKTAWLFPVLIGFVIGVLVCLVPTAIVLIVRRRKKASPAPAQDAPPAPPEPPAPSAPPATDS